MSKNLKIIIAIVTAIPVIGMFIGIVYPELFFSTQEATKNWLQSFGIIAPIVFVLLQIVQVIFPPISHYTVGILGGFIYGPWLGGFLNWLGRVIGHSIAFYLSRTFARKWVKKFISESELTKLDSFIAGKKEASPQSLILFLFYFLPFFPDDEISYVAGMSNMKYRVFLIANVLGHVGGALSLAYIGNGIDTRDPIFWILFIVTLAGFPLVLYLINKKNKVQ